MSRLQLALNVANLEASVAFYSRLLGVEPHKRRPGYANFVVGEPPLKLVLLEAPTGEGGIGPAGALNHLGIEVFSSEEVNGAIRRLSDAGLTIRVEADTVCCYARQDKVWVNDPDGAPWEVYVVTDDDPDGAGSASQAESACCSSGPAS